MGALEGKVAVVVGGSGGFGEAMVARFREEGAEVCSRPETRHAAWRAPGNSMPATTDATSRRAPTSGCWPKPCSKSPVASTSPSTPRATKTAVLFRTSNPIGCGAGPKGVRVNVVSATLVETPMAQNIVDAPGVRTAFMAKTPLGRFGTVEDIVNAVFWLASDQSAFVTGQNLLVDGGTSLRRQPGAEDFMRSAKDEAGR